MNPLFHPGLEHSFHFESFVQETFKLDLKHRPQAELIKASSALQQQQQQQNVCKYFLKGTCHRGTQCSFFHPKDARGVVCKHYLRGLCSKGDLCEFLHEYNLKRMPECWFFTKYGECSNPECLYLHIDPASKIKPCPWYARGFCKHGPDCKNKHVRKALCMMYLTGFCPKGDECPLGHPKNELPNTLPNVPDQNNSTMDNESSERTDQAVPRPPMMGQFQPPHHFQPQHPPPHYQQGFRPSGGHRSMDNITCFKCGERGHFANQCPKRRRFDEPSFE